MNQTEKDLNALILTLKHNKVITPKNISDEWHTFGDLYEHRMILTIALCNAINKLNRYIIDGSNESFGEDNNPVELDVWCYKSKRHNDNDNNPMFEGSFIVVIESPYGQISYHYDLKEWDKFDIQEVYEPEPYDGHNSNDVLERLPKIFIHKSI